MKDLRPWCSRYRGNLSTAFRVQSALKALMFGGLLLLLASCGGLSRNTASRDSSSTSSSAGSSVASAASAPTFERQLAPGAPRTAKYAGLQFTVTKGVISNRAPDVTDGDNSNPATADITLSVVNTLPEDVQLRNGLWQLRLGDGTTYKQPYEENITARDTQERKLSFRVPLAAKWDGAQLSFDEQDKEPAMIMLDGSSPQPPYPIRLAATGEATLKDPALVFTLTNASIDLDAFGRRAEQGKRYLNLTVRVANNETNAGEFLPEYIRLVVDGTPETPERDDNNTAVEPGSKVEHTMAFVIPANASSVELQLGKSGAQETAKIPIDLKATKS